ncbi:MAG TPA: tyrosine-protein phosphatase [Acidimicrobiales bacterium]|nr:tyrosine-protein phosphatase [Acidimicrobiales bacterium]
MTTVLENGIQFESIFNFRDLGGHPTVSRERTRYGRVFRSDGLHRSTPADIDVLVRLGIERVVDLRTAHERVSDGCFDPHHASVDYRHVPILDEVGAATQTLDGETEPLVATYLTMVTDRAERIVEAVRAIATVRGPVVFHCTAGKDRTGVVAALMLSAIGVADDAIAADYARSAAAMPQLLEWYRANRNEAQPRLGVVQAIDEERSRRLLGAEPAWIQFTLDAVRASHGSVRAHLIAAGATPSLLDRLADKLLA